MTVNEDFEKAFTNLDNFYDGKTHSFVLDFRSDEEKQQAIITMKDEELPL
jgi:hypothetical protein